MKTLFRVIPAILLALGLAACSEAGDVVESVDPDQAKVLLDEGATLIDIRTPAEIAEVRIDGATSIDFSTVTFTDQLASLDRNATYVIYCRSGNRTTAALTIFEDLGFDSVHAIDGGIQAWEAAGFPVARG